MPRTADATAARRTALVQELVDRGALSSQQWIHAFQTVPRENFVSRFAELNPHGADPWHDLDDPDGREAALDAVYRDAPLVTQYAADGTPISSSTQPRLMARMLEALDTAPGHRILEVGVGTGYNAALLSTVLDDTAVTTMDVDPDLVDTARAALATTGHHPHLFADDGARGAPDHAPFDRVIATCGFRSLPPAWLPQLAPDAVIVLPLGGGIVQLRTYPGGLRGRFIDYARFVAHRTAPGTTSHQGLATATNDAGERTRIAAVLPDADVPTFAALCLLAHPTLRHISLDRPAGTEHRWIDTATGAWARLAPRDAEHADLTEAGPGFYDDLVRLHTLWDQHGRAELTRYGLTVQHDGTHLLWLDHPEHPVTVLR